MISTSAPSTEIFTCLTSLSHRPPALLIATLGSADLIVCSLSTNHSSALWRSPCAHEGEGRDNERGHKCGSSSSSTSLLIPVQPRIGVRLPLATISGLRRDECLRNHLLREVAEYLLSRFVQVFYLR